MGSPAAVARILRFGVFEVDLKACELRRQGLRLKLPEQPFQVLVVLLENPGEIITREELRNRLWPGDTFVDFDHGLNNAVMRLREVLGDSSENPRFVETIPRRGYRFISRVEESFFPAVREKPENSDKLAADALPANSLSTIIPNLVPSSGAQPSRTRTSRSRVALIALAALAVTLALGAVAMHFERPVAASKAAQVR